jgi:hypothetical protein
MSTAQRIDYLTAMLPDWTIQPYGKTGAIVCYPPRGWNTDASNQDALRVAAPIAGIVSGNGLVVCQLQTEPVGAGVHPLSIW